MNGPHKMIILFQRPEGQDTEKKYKPRGPQNSKNPSKQPNPPTPPKPSVKRQRPRKPRAYLPVFQGKLENISDMIALADKPENYINIKVNKLRAIRDELVELNEMIGLVSIKQTIFEQLLFYIQNLHKDSDMYMNTVIYGPPGVGKTTVSKILGSMFSKLKILSEDGLFEILRRDDLVGEYLGSTAIKTQECLESCLGGVVFVDEIYSLGNQEKRDSFSKEAIDTMNLFLSENKDDFMMIVAGYKEEIENCFFSYNPGLRRRFMWYHTIEPYTPTELKQIFLSKINKYSWKSVVEESFLEELFHTHKDKFKDNGGSIENFITLLKIKHSSRVVLLPYQDKRKITKEDIQKTMKEFQKEDKKEEHMSMYL